ncbi:protein translocase subunit SecF [Anthocerotibacter panamensis]|uniref:protein translocase subunit SecF n=1 Tax=Anthocerotibacter panamensis TaxID=2857077 RepID=UPI001C402F18|nr:protein translocase subunit SecF [Anthocerotibacter panamensis]
MAIDVVGKRKLWLGLSAALVAVGIIAMLVSIVTLGSPVRLGIDFTGGTLLQLRFDKKEQVSNTGEVRAVLEKKNLGTSVIQPLGERDLQIRTSPLSQQDRLALQDLLKQNLKPFTIQGIQEVGPTLGKELFVNGLLSLLVTFGAIAVYVAWRFEPDFAVFAFLAMAHDVLIAIGFFAVLGLVAGVEVDTLFVVALLTIIGFSMTDTVVVYDRIRENVKFVSRKKPFAQVVNDSINQTFARSINTSLTALLTLFALFFFGGTTLKDFSLALIIGFASGTYSSIFNASILLVVWREYKARQKLNAKAS